MGLPTGDIEFHPIIVPGLPEQTDGFIVMPLLPTFVVGDELIEQPTDMLRIGMDRIDG